MPKKIIKKTAKKTTPKVAPKTEAKVEKLLGASSYKNSKQKKKLQQKKIVEVQKVVVKDRQIKVKIKHLQKEVERIVKSGSGNLDKKALEEKASIEKKIAQLSVINKKFEKKS
jgi:hypothetical protein